MLPILGGRRVRRFDWSSHGAASEADSVVPSVTLSQASLLRPPIGDAIATRATTTTTLAVSRRRYRSRNCRTFRQYGLYFHYSSEPRASTTSSDGRTAALGRQGTQLREQLEGTRRRVELLLAQRDLLVSLRVNARAHVVAHATDTTRRFYELFARGFDPVRHPAPSRAAEAFLRAALREDVVCAEFRGVDMFLQQYRAGTANHAAMALTLHRLTLLEDDGGDEHDGDDGGRRVLIKAEATARFRISRTTIERLFPSLAQDEPLVRRLIGREYEMQYDKVFYFASDGRVYQHESRIDLCSSLLQLVGDPLLALRLYEASTMTKRGHWRLDEVAEDRHELSAALL